MCDICRFGNGADTSVVYNCMLIATACWGNVNWIKALLSIGANPNAMVTSHLQSPTLNAVEALLSYAPIESGLHCLKVKLFQSHNIYYYVLDLVKEATRSW